MRQRLLAVAAVLAFAALACETEPMPFPFSREETATPASPVSSNTTNAIQDAILDLYSARDAGYFNAARWRDVPLYSGINSFSNGHGSHYMVSGANAEIIDLPIPADVGDTVSAFRWTDYGDGSVDGVIALLSCLDNALGTEVAIESTPTTNPPAAYNTHTFTFAAPIVISATMRHFIRVTASAANLRIGRPMIHVARPAP